MKRNFTRDEGDLSFHVIKDGLFVNLAHLGSGTGITISRAEAEDLHTWLGTNLSKIPQPKKRK